MCVAPATVFACFRVNAGLERDRVIAGHHGSRSGELYHNGKER